MKDADMKKIGLGALVVVVILFGVYQYDPYLFTRLTAFEGFTPNADAQDDTAKKAADAKMAMDKKEKFSEQEKLGEQVKKEKFSEQMKKEKLQKS